METQWQTLKEYVDILHVLTTDLPLTGLCVRFYLLRFCRPSGDRAHDGVGEKPGECQFRHAVLELCREVLELLHDAPVPIIDEATPVNISPWPAGETASLFEMALPVLASQ